MVANLLAVLLTLATTAQQAYEYRIEAIRYGTISQFPVAGLVVGAPEDERLDIAMMFWVIRGDGRSILFDTGFYRESWMERFDIADFIRPDEALRLVGLDPADVTDIIISHTHWDHVGGIDLFPNATIWIEKAEFEAQRLDGIIVVHLSYAPSLISVPALTETRLPLLWRHVWGSRHGRTSGSCLIRRAVARCAARRGAGAGGGPCAAGAERPITCRTHDRPRSHPWSWVPECCGGKSSRYRSSSPEVQTRLPPPGGARWAVALQGCHWVRQEYPGARRPSR